MADNPKQMAVPTLDVDLAWHTHQLSPMQYYNCSVGLASSPLRFMDHNDKVDEVDLTIGFEWTCKAYREVTDGEIYSECVCWFCEAVRYPDLYGHFRSSLLWLSDARKAVEDLRRQHDHASKSDNGPHISVHSAVRPQKISEVDRIKRETRALQLLEAYRKSLRRAKKHSRSSKALVSAIAAVNSVVLPTSPPTDTVISQDEISTSFGEDEVNPERKDHVQNIKDVFDVIDHVVDLLGQLFPNHPHSMDGSLNGQWNCISGTCGSSTAGGNCVSCGNASACGASAGCGGGAGGCGGGGGGGGGGGSSGCGKFFLVFI